MNTSSNNPAATRASHGGVPLPASTGATGRDGVGRGIRGLAAATRRADPDRPGHRWVRRANVAVGAGLGEPDRRRLALGDVAGVERPARGRRRVGDRVGVRPRDAVADIDRDRRRGELEPGDRDGASRRQGDGATDYDGRGCGDAGRDERSGPRARERDRHGPIVHVRDASNRAGPNPPPTGFSERRATAVARPWRQPTLRRRSGPPASHRAGLDQSPPERCRLEASSPRALAPSLPQRPRP